MTRRLSILSLLLVLALIAAACAGEEGETTTTAAPTTTEAPTTTAAPTTTEPGMEYEGLSYTADCAAEGYTGEFASMEAVDEYTVKFTLCAPDPAFPSKVAFSAFAIWPQEVIEGTGGGGPELFKNPIGTGPYKFDTWEEGSQIVLKRNDDYWGDAAKTETLVFKWGTEAAQRMVELQAGTVDGIDNIGPDDFVTVQNDPNLQLIERPALNIFYVGLNNAKEPLGDVRVRRALAMGIDKQRIVDNFYPPGSSAAEQFLPPAIPGYAPGVDWYDFDPEAAKALLAEAGYPNGFTVPLQYRDVVRGYLPQVTQVVQDIADQLADIGVTAEIEVQESGTFIDNSDAGNLTIYLLGWGADYPDATNFLDFHFGFGASKQFGEIYTDIAAVLQEAASLSDQAERDVLYRQAAELIKEDVPMIPVAHGGSGLAYRADIDGAHASPLSNEYFAVMDPGGRDTFVWMQNAEPIGLYCADETDGETLRLCEQVNESLLAYEVGGVAVGPSLATDWAANDELTEWTFTLRQGVTFHDGSAFDANDVVTSYYVQWDAASPLHVGRDGSFTYFPGLFGGFLNPPPAEG